MNDRRVLTGRHFMNGDEACAEGALAAGCSFFGGYPITPSTEIAEHLARRMPETGGIFIQMEDELGSMAAILGASAAGARSMTATSGPGLSLMMENLGLAVMLELPCVVVDVQRGSPSTGLPTMPGQSDVMQARWGSHGDYEIAAYSPWLSSSFRGFIVGLWLDGELYRFATYTGAKIEMIRVADDRADMVIGDAKHMLEMTAAREHGGLLRGPTQVDMGLRVGETLGAEVQVLLREKNGQEVFSGCGRHAGLEIQGDIERLLAYA